MRRNGRASESVCLAVGDHNQGPNAGRFVHFLLEVNVPWLSLPSSWQNLMHASFCLLLWQPVLALHPAPRAAPALGARRTAPPARAVRHDAPRMSTDSNPDSLEDVFEALLKVRPLGWIGLGLGLGLVVRGASQGAASGLDRESGGASLM